jgi:hypothetical protein
MATSRTTCCLPDLSAVTSTPRPPPIVEALLAPQVFSRLVDNAGWSLDDYKRWVLDFIQHAILQTLPSIPSGRDPRSWLHRAQLEPLGQDEGHTWTCAAHPSLPTTMRVSTKGLAGLPRGRGFAAVFTLAAPQAKDGPTDIFARIGPGR